MQPVMKPVTKYTDSLKPGDFIFFEKEYKLRELVTLKPVPQSNEYYLVFSPYCSLMADRDLVWLMSDNEGNVLMSDDK